MQAKEFDVDGRLVAESGIIFGTDLSFERHYLLAEHEDASKDGANKSNQGSTKDKCTPKKAEKGHKHCQTENTTEPEAPVDLGPQTDCDSDAFSFANWYWTKPYEAQTVLFPEIFQAAGATWQNETGQQLFGNITQGYQSAAGTQDFLNQIDFMPMSQEIIAVTTTWFYTSSGIAVESDSSYNLYHPWTTIENPVGMDLLGTATHELGHTIGLDHPEGPVEEISCLTMYAFSTAGDFEDGTLGDGDILGIQARYGSAE